MRSCSFVKFQALIVMLEHLKCDELTRALCRSLAKFDVCRHFFKVKVAEIFFRVKPWLIKQEFQLAISLCWVLPYPRRP